MSSAVRILEVSAYCECDVVNTYRVWLRYELFRGELSRTEFKVSEDHLLRYLSERVATKPHLVHLMECRDIRLDPSIT